MTEKTFTDPSQSPARDVIKGPQSEQSFVRLDFFAKVESTVRPLLQELAQASLEIKKIAGKLKPGDNRSELEASWAKEAEVVSRLKETFRVLFAEFAGFFGGAIETIDDLPENLESDRKNYEVGGSRRYLRLKGIGDKKMEFWHLKISSVDALLRYIGRGEMFASAIYNQSNYYSGNHDHTFSEIVETILRLLKESK
jgi:hypothetical protein